MPRPDTFLDRLASRRMRHYLTRAAEVAPTVELDALREMRAEARRLRRGLDGFLHVADGRLALPLLGTNAMNRPPVAVWLWRPELWRGPVEPRGVAGVQSRTRFGVQAEVLHDCPLGEVTLRQVRNAGSGDLAPFGMVVDVLGFQGSFLSLVIDLPPSAAEGLSRRHTFRTELAVERDRYVAIYGRLNIRHGPNTEQINARTHGPDHALAADFDLGLTLINENRVERLWLELFFEAPAMSCVTLSDVTMSRRPRADL
jgi:hypothetical protein